METKSKAELIGSILERLAEEPFHAYVEDGQDAIILRKRDEIDFHEKEEEFVHHLLMTKIELELVEGREVDLDDFKVNWSDWETKCLLRKINHRPIASDVLDKLLQEMGLSGLGYEGVITTLYQSLCTGESPYGQELVGLRESLSAKNAAEREAFILNALRDSTPDVIAESFAKRLGRRFPKMVKRCEKLNALPTDHKAPDSVQRYLLEASQLYVEGHFFPCLIMCRAALELALRDRLSKYSIAKRNNSSATGDDDSLATMIAIGREHLPWPMNQAMADVELVRKAANDALHKGPGKEQLCEELFKRTRAAVKTLYTEPDVRLPG